MRPLKPRHSPEPSDWRTSAANCLMPSCIVRAHRCFTNCSLQLSCRRMRAAGRTDRLAMRRWVGGRCRRIGKAALAARDLPEGKLAARYSRERRMMRSRVGAGSAKGRRPLSRSMGGGRCGPASPTPRQKPKKPTYGRQRRAIGGTEPIVIGRSPPAPARPRNRSPSEGGERDGSGGGRFARKTEMPEDLAQHVGRLDRRGPGRRAFR